MRATRTTTHSNYRPHSPKSFGTQGENKQVAACQEAHIHIQCYNVRIHTRYHVTDFSCDLVTEPNQEWTDRFMPQIAGEVQGEFHFTTWGGRPAKHQADKDQVKRNCLIAEGYRYVEATRREVLTGIEESQRAEWRRLGIKRPHNIYAQSVLPGHILLDRMLRAWDDEHWLHSRLYLEAVAQRPNLIEQSSEQAPFSNNARKP